MSPEDDEDYQRFLHFLGERPAERIQVEDASVEISPGMRSLTAKEAFERLDEHGQEELRRKFPLLFPRAKA